MKLNWIGWASCLILSIILGYLTIAYFNEIYLYHSIFGKVILTIFSCGSAVLNPFNRSNTDFFMNAGLLILFGTCSTLYLNPELIPLVPGAGIYMYFTISLAAFYVARVIIENIKLKSYGN